MPAVLRKPTTLNEYLKTKGLAKFIMPKVSKVLTNLVQLGPRVILRSAQQLLRVNPLTRLISVTSLVAVDVVLLAKAKISRSQFFINLAYSLTMFAGSTVGWYTGSQIARQFALDFFLAFVVSLVFLLLGNQVANRVTSVIVGKVATTDCEKGLAEINRLCPAHLTIEVTKYQCIEAFRQHDDAKTQYIAELISTAVQNSATNSVEALPAEKRLPWPVKQRAYIS